MWTLIFIIAVGSPSTPVAVHQEFLTESTCKNAEETIRADLLAKGWTPRWGIIGGCLPK